MGKVAWKEVEPFVGLLLTTAITLYAREYLRADRDLKKNSSRLVLRLGSEALVRKKKIYAAVIAGVSVAFLIIGLLFYVFRLPAYLETTHKAVSEFKLEARSQCRAFLENDDFGHAESWIRNNTLGRVLKREAEAKRRVTIDQALRPVTYAVFLRSGPFISVVPIFVVLILSLALRLLGKPWPRFLPTEADWSFVLLPAIYSSLYITWVSSTVFHFWIRERQVKNCMLVSGEWYVVFHSVFSFVITTFFLRMESTDPKDEQTPGERSWTTPKSSLSTVYILWFAVYLGLSSGLLADSQRYFHDWEESLAGISYMLKVMVFSAGAAIVGYLYGLENAFVEKNPEETENTDVDILKAAETIASSSNSSFDSNIKCGQVCKVLTAFTAESESELSVLLGQVVRTISEDMNGWIEVETMEENVGFVPSSFLTQTEEKFQIEVHKKRREAFQEAMSEKVNKGREDKSVSASGSAEPPPPPPTTSNPIHAPSRAAPAFLQDVLSGGVQLKKVKKDHPAQKNKEPAPSRNSLMDHVAKAVQQRREAIDGQSEDDADWE